MLMKASGRTSWGAAHGRYPLRAGFWRVEFSTRQLAPSRLYVHSYGHTCTRHRIPTEKPGRRCRRQKAKRIGGTATALRP